jgi:hypothetical protein
MSNLSELRPPHLELLATVEHNTTRLLPLLNLLETPDGPDRVAQLLELLRLILDMQHHQVAALKVVSDKVDRFSRR